MTFHRLKWEYDPQTDLLVPTTGSGLDVPEIQADSISTEEAAIDNVGTALSATNSQTISNNTETKIAWGNAEFDHFGAADLSNNKISIQKEGTYLIIGRMLWNNTIPDGTNYELTIKLNGSRLTVHFGAAAAADYTEVETSTTAELVTGDEIEMFAYQKSGGDVSILGTDGVNQLQAVRVG